MKTLKRLLIITFISITSCKTTNKQDYLSKIMKDKSVTFLGEKFSHEAVLSKDELLDKYEGLAMKDTIKVKFMSTINSVCKKKGCWMRLDLGRNKESLVRFKNYSFFVPLNSENKKVIINGKAFVNETSIEELKHYAEDAGKTEEEISKITKPEFTYAFEASGVLMALEN